MRYGVLVTSDRKKLWNVQLNLLVEVDRICRKHGIKWSLAGGTLIGAIRHQGFVPWDDEAEIEMFRPEYEKFKRVAQEELDPDFYFDLWCNYVVEGDPNPDNLPVIKREQLKKYPWLPFSPFLKLRDNSTTFIKYPDFDNLVQGIGIDIFPMDPVPPFDNPKHQEIFERGEELRYAVTYPERLVEGIERGDHYHHSYDRLRELLSLPFRDRALLYEKYLADNWFESEFSSLPTFNSLKAIHKMKEQPTAEKQDLITAKFEGLEVPVFKNYDSILTRQYGDWRTPLKYHIHTNTFSADVPYKEYFKAHVRWGELIG